MKIQLFLGAAAIALAASHDDSDDTPLPVILWHGLGDDATGEGVGQVGDLADEINPGTFFYPINLSKDGSSSDRSETFFGNVSEQISRVCETLASHPILSTAPAVDAIGFSQGGQFLRGYIERCNKPPVRSLVTFGSQHNGITEFKDCAPSDFLCKGAMAVLRYNVWGSYAQSSIVPAQYYRPTEDYNSYLESSSFLADINNERREKNAQYKKNLASLTKFVMYQFANDTVVIPKDSSWFDEIVDGERVALRKRNIYREDWIGLRELDQKGALEFKSIEGEHMRIGEQTLRDAIKNYFGPMNRKFAAEAPVSEDQLVVDEL